MTCLRFHQHVGLAVYIIGGLVLGAVDDVSSFSPPPPLSSVLSSKRSNVDTAVVANHQNYHWPIMVAGNVNQHRNQRQYVKYGGSTNYHYFHFHQYGRISKTCHKTRMNLIPTPTDPDTAAFWFSTLIAEYFDGSTIIDPMVVSNVFWSRLQANIISVVIGQCLAAIVFSLLLSFATSQLRQLFSNMSEQFLKTSTATFTTDSTTTAKQQQPQQLRIPRKLRETDETTTTTIIIQPDIGKLFVCIAIDTIGSSSILLPFIGDASDILWAPMAGLLLRYLFYNSSVVFIFELIEEVLPFTDIVPLATICWIVDTYYRDSTIANVLRLGVFSSPSSSISDRDRSDAIDILRSNKSKSDRT